MNNKCAVLAAIILLYVAAATAAETLEVPLEYISFAEDAGSPVPNMDYTPWGSASIDKLETAPPGDWRLPPFNSDKPVFGLVTLRDSSFLMVADMEHKSDRFYSVLYFDVNHNGDLTDDGALEPTEIFIADDNQYRYVNFPALDLETVHGNTKLPYRMTINMYAQEPDDEAKDGGPESWWPNLWVRCRLLCIYQGTLQLDDNQYTIVLIDKDINGRFDDRATLSEHSDTVLYPVGDALTLWQQGNASYYDELILARYLWIGDALYQLAVDTPNKRMTLTPVTENLGPLALPEGVERLLIMTEETETTVAAFRPGASVQVPSGKYRLLSYQFYRNDPQGDRWGLNARGTTKMPWVEVTAGKQARMAFGEPFIPMVQITPWSLENFRAKQTEDVVIEFEVRGQAGEQVTNLAHLIGDRTKIALSRRDRSRPKEPTYKIIKPDGEIVVSGSFEYG